MALTTHPTRLIAMPEYATIQSAASANTLTAAQVRALTFADNLTLLGTVSGITAANAYAYVIASGEADAEGTFLDACDIVVDEANEKIYLRGDVRNRGGILYGKRQVAAFVVPKCNGGVLTNNNNATIYYRKGPANGIGLTIGFPGNGDSDSENVYGTPLYANGQRVFSSETWPPGTEIHLVGTAASQTATVAFE